MGDKLLQKTYSNDFLDKTRRKNEGQVPQVYVEGCHEAIIPARTFRRVQEEIERRKNCHASGGTIFSARIFCGDCGQMYGPKVWHSKDTRYRRTVWQCNGKFNGHRCKAPHLTEEEIQQGFIKAMNKLLAEAQESLHQKEKRNEQTLDFISEIETMPDSITEFRTDYWGHLVEKITVYRKGTMTFAFACGVEVQI